MEIIITENSIVKQRLKNNDFEALIIRFLNDQKTGNFRNYFGVDSYTGYNNKKLDSIINLLEDTGDVNEIDDLYNELAPIFERDIPITFFSPIVQTHIVNSRVKGLEDLFRSDPVRYLETLWIE